MPSGFDAPRRIGVGLPEQRLGDASMKTAPTCWLETIEQNLPQGLLSESVVVAVAEQHAFRYEIVECLERVRLAHLVREQLAKRDPDRTSHQAQRLRERARSRR